MHPDPIMRTAQPSEIEHLKQVELFENLSHRDLELILGAAYEQTFKEDKYLFFQGDPADVFYVLLEGHIKLSQLTPEGNQVILHYLNPGEAFGIIAVLRKIDFPVTAQVVEDCRVLAWDHQTMKQLMLRHPQMTLNAIQILSKHILQFQNRIRELATERVERRIARALLRLAQQSGRKAEEGITIDLGLTRQDIAEMAGTTMYTVSRTLSKWQSEDLLDWRGEMIVIKSPHELVNIAEDLNT